MEELESAGIIGFDPPIGLLPARSSAPLKVTYRPTLPEKNSFRVFCDVVVELGLKLGFGAPPSPSRNSTRRGRGQGRGHGQGSVKRSRSPMATRRSKTVSVSFTEGSLGLEFVSSSESNFVI